MTDEEIVEMAKQAGASIMISKDSTENALTSTAKIIAFAALVDAKATAREREACAKVCEEFARKWWKIHCDSNIHYSSTLKAHQDFCALQAAIRARGDKHD